MESEYISVQSLCLTGSFILWQNCISYIYLTNCFNIDFRYKAPFLRGDMDPTIDKHEKIEELMADDLENWLCNLYFEIVKLPR